MQQKYIKALDIDYRNCERCSARTMTDKKQMFVKYRDELPMKFIERWLSRPAKVPVNVPDEAHNIYFRPAKPILLWSSSHTDRRRSTEMGYISISCLAGILAFVFLAEDIRGVRSSFINCLSLDPATIYNQMTPSWIYLWQTAFLVRKYIYIQAQ